MNSSTSFQTVLIISRSKIHADGISQRINDAGCNSVLICSEVMEDLKNGILDYSPSVIVLDGAGAEKIFKKTVDIIEEVFELDKTILVIDGKTHKDEIVWATQSGINTILHLKNLNKLPSKIIEIISKNNLFSFAGEYSKKIYDARYHLIQFSNNHTLEEILQETLDQICALTNSKIGFYHFLLNDEKNISLQAWSTETKEKFCTASGAGLHYPVDEAGVWADCVKQRKPIIHNDYPSLRENKGLPHGHAQVVRELVVPVFRDSTIVAILGVGNKDSLYHQADVDLVSTFADLVWDIAERKRFENQLSASELRFRTFVEQANGNIFLLSREGIFTYISPNWKETLGYDSAEVIGKSFEEFVFKDDLTRCREFLRDTFKTKKKSKGVEYRVRCKKGNWQWHTTNSAIIYDQNSHTELFLGISHDISGLKEAEIKLKEEKEQVKRKLKILTQPYGNFDQITLADLLDLDALQSMMNDFYKLTKIGIGIIDMDGNILIKNGWQRICTDYHRIHPETHKNCLESDLELTRFTEINSINCYRCKNNMWDISTPIIVEGKHLGNIFLGQFMFDDEVVDERLFRQQAKTFGFDEEDYLLALNEVPRWNQETVNTTMQFYTKLAQIISSMSLANLKLVKINQEKQQLINTLSESEDRYRNLVNSSPASIFVVQDNHYVFANPAGLRALGYDDFEPLKNISVLETIHPDSQKSVLERIKKADLGKKNTPLEMKIIQKNGDIIITESTSVPIKINGKNAILVISHDITERKKIEEDLLAANLRLQALWNLTSINGDTNEITSEKVLLPILEMTKSDFGFIGNFTPEKDVFQINFLVNQTNHQNEIKNKLPFVVDENINIWRDSLSETDSRIFNKNTKNLTLNGIMDVPLKKLLSIPLGRPYEQNTILVVANSSSNYDEGDIQQIKTFLNNLQTIQEKKRAETALKKSEVLLNETQKLSKVGGWEYDVKKRVLIWSNETYYIHGIEPSRTKEENDQIIGMSLECYAPSDREKVREAFNLCIQHGTPYKIEAEFRSYDGKDKWIQTIGEPVYENGNILKVRGNIIDITETKKTQLKLKEQTNLLEASQKTAHLGSYQINLIDGSVYWSKETFRIFGYHDTSTTPTVSDYRALIYAEDVDQVFSNFDQSISTGKPFNVTYRIMQTSGEIRYVHSIGDVVRNAQGEITHLEGTIQDVTEGVKLQIALQESLQEKEILLREVHHRVKNNLAAIIGILDLERFAKPNNGQNLFLTEITNRVRSIAMVHENLYQSDDLSKIDFQTYLTSLMTHLKTSFHNKVNPTINIHAEKITLSLDIAVPCGLIINELVTNAIKHAFLNSTMKKTSYCTIEIFMEKDQDHYRLVVSDNGVGLPDEVDLNEPNTMGLKLVKMLGVYQLNGSIDVIRSGGTKYLLTFPADEENTKP